jgi:hypothetical protein
MSRVPAQAEPDHRDRQREQAVHDRTPARLVSGAALYAWPTARPAVRARLALRLDHGSFGCPVDSPVHVVRMDTALQLIKT